MGYRGETTSLVLVLNGELAPPQEADSPEPPRCHAVLTPAENLWLAEGKVVPIATSASALSKAAAQDDRALGLPHRRPGSTRPSLCATIRPRVAWVPVVDPQVDLTADKLRAQPHPLAPSRQ